MRTLRILLLSLVAGLGMMGAKAQIGYQISLLNTATGEPRANETVTVTVSLSNNASEVFYSETKQATTNDFGVLSLSIGNADTFANIDFTKMPFFIEVTANGVNIGKSQMLSVPVAEYAKRTGQLSPELLIGTWVCEYDANAITSGIWGEPYQYMRYVQVRNKWVFNADGTCKHIESNKHWTVGEKGGDNSGEDYDESEYYYIIDGNTILLHDKMNEMPLYNGTYTYHSDYTYGKAYSIYYFPTLELLTFSPNDNGSYGYIKQK